MVHSTEVHCPFCHQKSEFHNAPVGSTVRCSTCRSIFRVPSEGTHRVGVKVKKYKASRHSPIYYVVLLILIGGGAYGYYRGRNYIEANKFYPPWDPRCKAEDPFKDRIDLGDLSSPDDTTTRVRRIMECWKIGSNHVNDTTKCTGFQSMLRYVRYANVLDKTNQEDPAGEKQ